MKKQILPIIGPPTLAEGKSILNPKSHIGRTRREKEKNANRIARRAERDSGRSK